MEISEVADMAQIALNDTAASVWPQATVETWVLEAIRDYETRLQFIAIIDQYMTGVVWTLDLPQPTVDVLAVEYPWGYFPPNYLTRFSRFDPRFYDSDQYYDWEPRLDRSHEPILYLSAETTPNTMITFTLKYLYYDYTWGGQTVLVPDQHIPVLINFVVWRAMQERLATAVQTIEYKVMNGMTTSIVFNNTDIVATLAAVAAAARNLYEASLAAAIANLPDTTPPPH